MQCCPIVISPVLRKRITSGTGKKGAVQNIILVAVASIGNKRIIVAHNQCSAQLGYLVAAFIGFVGGSPLISKKSTHIHPVNNHPSAAGRNINSRFSVQITPAPYRVQLIKQRRIGIQCNIDIHNGYIGINIGFVTGAG